MNLQTMKKIIFTLLCLMGVMMGFKASAQLRSAYFMEGSYFRTDLNPALAPTRGYVALPLLSGMGLSVNSNFLSVDNFFYKQGDQVVSALHSAVSADEFLGNLPEIEKLSFNANVNLLGVGFYTRKTFWNFGANLRSQNDLALSKDLFRVFKTLGNGVYDFSDTSLNTTSWLEAYVGASHKFFGCVTLGVRLKFLTGLLNASTEVEQIQASVMPDIVKGHAYIPLRASGIFLDPTNAMAGSSFSSKLYSMDPNYLLSHMKSFGGAIDLGGEVSLFNKHLRISAAVTDLGFIRWSGASRLDGEVKADFYFKGYELSEMEPDYDASAEIYMLTPNTENYTTRLTCSLNVGAEYNFLRNHIAVGLFSHTEFCQTMTYSELTASINFRPTNWISATVSHTFCNKNALGVPGIALNIHPRAINFFIGADYLGLQMAQFEGIPIPRSMKSFNVYMGLGFNFKRPKSLL